MSLQSFFTTEDKEPRIVLDHEKTYTGGVLAYVAPRKDVVVHSSSCVPADMQSDFARYFFSVLGDPRSLQVKGYGEEDASVLSRHVIASQYTEITAPVAHALGRGDAVKAARQFNNKADFQKIVSDVLGDESGTRAVECEEGMEMHQAKKKVRMLLESGHHSVVVRIADDTRFVSAGKGVGFLRMPEELEGFLRVRNLVEGARTAVRFLLEPFIPSVASPSVTFHLDEHGVTEGEVNTQLLQEGRFLASTNLVPASVRRAAPLFRSQARQLAEDAWRRGLRDFVGFDTLLRPDGTTVFLESNARQTGSTIPRLLLARAYGFSGDERQRDWVNVNEVAFRPCQTHNDSLASRLQWLDDRRILFDRTRGERRRLHTIVHAGADADSADMLFFWEREKEAHGEALQPVFDVLHDLGYDSVLSPPTA